MSTVSENINEVECLVSGKVGCKYAVVLSAGMAVKLAGVAPGEKVYRQGHLGHIMPFFNGDNVFETES